jgi:DNA-binding CsgD family transcriptional regulator
VTPPTAPTAIDASGAAPGAVGGVSLLTAREIEVLRLIAGGLSNRTAAAHLTVNLRTVESHLTNMGRKLGLTRRALIASARDLLAALPPAAAPAPRPPA